MNNNVENTNEKYTIPFIIPYYMMSLILPKCNIIHGEVLSSVYLQIALYVNNKKGTNNWGKNKSWVSVETISENTGYNIRIINSNIKLLEKLQLISIEQQKNKLMKFTLLNNKYTTQKEIINFNFIFEQRLLKNLNRTLTNKYNNKFRELETIICYPKNKKLTQNLRFNDINVLRSWLLEISKVYKGSSLFFLTNIAMLAFKYRTNDTLLNLSQTERAIRLGTSQKTISRYIEAYINADYLTVIEGNINKPIILGINPKFLNINLEKVVIDKMQNKIICPICGKDFYEVRSLNVHISKTQDPKHKMLNLLKKQRSDMDINQLYLDNKTEFDELDIAMQGLYTEDTKEVKQPKTYEYLNIPCDCKMTCKECHKNWKLDYYNDCNHERKEAFIKEYLNEDEDKKMVKVASKNNTIQVDKEDFNVIKPTKKQKIANGVSAPDLLKYFYSSISGTSPNFGKECGQIKNLLKKYTTDEIKLALDYLKRRGNTDLRFLNNSIKDAIVEQQYIIDADVDGTEAYLVKLYYEGMGQPLNLQTLVRDVQKIKETINSGKTYEQVKMTVQYMADIKCPTINFIGFKINEALAKGGKVNNIQNNPSYVDRDTLVIIRDQLLSAKTKIKKIDDEFRNDALKIARELFSEGKFTDKFGHFEWAWRIGLDLDYEMYQIAKNTQYKELSLNSVLNSPELPQEKKAGVENLKNNYEKWLQNQLIKFEGVQNN